MGILKDEIKESREFLSVLYGNFKLIVSFVILSCIFTAVITLVTPKKYRSYAIIFPTESNSIDDVIRNPQFGYDVEADRLIQVLESRNIRDSIMKRFDLLHYYKIDLENPDWYDRFKKKYDKDITFSKSVFMSITITATTKSPELSAKIVNGIILLVNSTRNKLLKQNLVLAVNSLQKEYFSLKKDLDSLTNVITEQTKSRKGVSQFIQSDRYISLIFDKSQFERSDITQALQVMVNQYNIRLSWFYDVQNRLKNAKLMLDRPLPSVYVVDNAIPSYRKVSPIYSVNLLCAFFGSLVFITFLLFLQNKIRKYLPKKIK